MQKEHNISQPSSQPLAETPKTLLQELQLSQQAINANGHERLTALQKRNLSFYALEHYPANLPVQHKLKQQLLSILLANYQEDVAAFDDTVYALKNQLLINTQYVQLLMQQPNFDKQLADNTLSACHTIVELSKLFNTFVHYNLDIYSTNVFTK